MVAQVLVQDGLERIEQSRTRLRKQTWGDGVHTVCMMSALVPGVDSVNDCVTAGWPSWMAQLCIALFDADIGERDEISASYLWARHIAMAVSRPVDYEIALAHFVGSVLTRTNRIQSIPELRQLHDLWRQRRATGVGDEIAMDNMARTFQRMVVDMAGYTDDIANLRRRALYMGCNLSALHPAGELVEVCRDLCELRASKATMKQFDDEWLPSWDDVWHKERRVQRSLLKDALLIGEIDGPIRQAD